MVRSISAAAQTKLNQNLGTEPINIIEIQWVDGGSIYTYSDKDLGSDEGKILNVSGLDNTVVVQGVSSGTSGDSQQISVTLDDTDGSIKAILDTHDVHKEPGWIYQSFEGLDLDDKFLIFKGQISSPIQWNEGDRTVTFDIITRIEDAEVGFSAEEGDFDNLSEELIGKSWPLVFGTVKLCPAMRTRSPRVGQLQTGFGIVDFMLQPKIIQAGLTCCHVVFTGWRLYKCITIIGGVEIICFEPKYEPESVCACKLRAVTCEYELNLAAQLPHQASSVTIIGGEGFRQGVFLDLDVNGAVIYGKFDGTDENPSNLFLISGRTHPKKASGEIRVPPHQNFFCPQRPFKGQKYEAVDSNGTKVCTIDGDCGGYNIGFNPIKRAPAFTETGKAVSKASWDHLASFKLAGFFWAEPGSEVTLLTDREFVHVVNILPSTVHQVKAWRTFSHSNLRQLTTVPNTYYTTRFSDFNGYTVTEVVFETPLSQRGEGWEDDIFVTHTSSVGDNPVDILEWLIDKYTDFGWDATFADIKTKVEKYPMNFMVPGRMNILTLLQEMCWQGRMAIVLRDDEFSLKYLSEEPISDGTITETDVLANSLVLDHTDTEDLVTKFVAEWRPECNLDDPYRVILRYNIKRYGTHEDTFDFYCYNIHELVLKSATFWLIRMANTWKKIICKTPVNKLALEVLDGCFVTLADIADGEIKCRVENATYNSSDHTIDFRLLTPVRSGEMTPYAFHYPANIDVEVNYPTKEDLQFGNAGGFGPNVNVTAPTGHVLSNESNATISITLPPPLCGRLGLDSCRPDQGDDQPSDTDDVKPLIALQDDNSEIPPGQSPVGEISENEFITESNELSDTGTRSDSDSKNADNSDSGTGGDQSAGICGGAGTGGEDCDTSNKDDMLDLLEDQPTPDELTEKNICHFDAVFFTDTLGTVRIKNGTSCGEDECDAEIGWCYCGFPGTVGCPVGNVIPSGREVVSYSNIEDRNAAVDEAGRQISTQQTTGQTIVFFASTQTYNPEGCEDQSGDGSIIGYERSGDESVVGVNNLLLGAEESVECDF